MHEETKAVADPTAVRVALWRALHVQHDAPPPVLEDETGLQLAAPAPGWRERPDMNLDNTRGYRAGVVARTRFVEDFVIEQAGRGIDQYVLLGAGLDTFAQRHAEVASRLRLFEVDRPGPQAWKRQRLIELGFGVPDWLRFVPVDFEAGQSWRAQLDAAGFDAARPAIVVSAGVSMYLTREANLATLRQIATLAPGSTLAMSFLLPLDLVDPVERPMHAFVYERAAESGTPFLSLFSPQEALALAREAGFREARHLDSAAFAQPYFAGRSDGLRPATGEDFLLAQT